LTASGGERRAGAAQNGGGLREGAELHAGGNGGGGDWRAPLTGDDYVDWSDRMRDVEEMLDSRSLQSDVARIRDRARTVRIEYKKLGKKPDWAVIQTQISTPLAELRSRIGEELARRESKEALVPIDRDPVPAKYSELVRLYYEKLGKSQ
jgi:hypothetical protein